MRSALFVLVLRVTATMLDLQAQSHLIESIPAASNDRITQQLGGSAPSGFKPYFDLYDLASSHDLLKWTHLPPLLRTNQSAAPLIFIDFEPGARTKFFRVATNNLITPLPLPTGAYAVGSRSILVTDPSRTNRYNIRTNSSFMVTLWYPAALRTDMHAPYIENRLSTIFAALYGVNQSVLSEFYSHSLLDAPIAKNSAPYPVIIYSHGFAVSRRDNTAKAEELASHGYIVVAIDHSDCRATVFPDDRLHTSSISSLSLSLFTNNVRDIEFVLDQTLSHLNQEDALFRGMLDLENVGTMGWSYGGGVAAEVARTDARVKAAVLLEAYLQNAHDVAWFGVQKPLLAMYNSTTFFTDVFNNADRDVYWLQIKNTEHQHFADWLGWISSPTASGRRAAGAMNGCMLAFFNKYLKNQDDPVLDNPEAVYPEIFNFRKK